MTAFTPETQTPDPARFADLLQEYAHVLGYIEAGCDDYIQEYENDIDVRTLIQKMLETGFVPTAPAYDRLAALDQQFRSMLAPIKGSLGMGTEDATVYFWWYGLPRNMVGELLRDAISYGYVTEDWPPGNTS